MRFRAIAPEQHFAEKIHAFTRTWEGVENSRTRDLVDLMLLLDFGLGKADTVRAVLEGVFESRKTHPLPPTLPDPPASWDAEYARLAQELSLGQATVAAAMQRLRDFWSGIQILSSPPRAIELKPALFLRYFPYEPARIRRKRSEPAG